jgi:periplasmic protein TonB
LSAAAERPIDVASAETPALPPRVRTRDPVALILGPSDRFDVVAAFAAVAFMLHVVFLASAILSGLLRDMRLAVQDNRAKVHEFFWRVYDVEVPKDRPKPEEKPPEPEAPPEPAPPKPAPKAEAPKEDDPYKNIPPPAPAQAAKVLVQKEDPDEPKDLTGNTVVTGEGSATYGAQSAAGTGDKPTMAKNASLLGKPGGTGTGTAPPAPDVDRSRPIALVGGSRWNCPFPPEADAEQIDQAVVTVQVTVRPDGTALSATVTADPGHGFGPAARRCALAKRYNAALDRAGNPILSSTPVNVRFSR